jgi:zinc D-Ala-D-Ala carboxypeptidase
MQLSKNFSLLDLTDSMKAHELGISNQPNLIQIDRLSLFCDMILEPIFNHYGKKPRINSGFRCFELNAAIGGEPDSQHTKGEAGDIKMEGIRNDELWHFIVDNLNFDQCIAEKFRLDQPSAGWIHVSHRYSGKQRKEALSWLGKKPYLQGLHYL